MSLLSSSTRSSWFSLSLSRSSILLGLGILSSVVLFIYLCDSGFAPLLNGRLSQISGFPSQSFRFNQVAKTYDVAECLFGFLVCSLPFMAYSSRALNEELPRFNSMCHCSADYIDAVPPTITAALVSNSDDTLRLPSKLQRLHAGASLQHIRIDGGGGCAINAVCGSAIGDGLKRPSPCDFVSNLLPDGLVALCNTLNLDGARYMELFDRRSLERVHQASCYSRWREVPCTTRRAALPEFRIRFHQRLANDRCSGSTSLQ